MLPAYIGDQVEYPDEALGTRPPPQVCALEQCDRQEVEQREGTSVEPVGMGAHPWVEDDVITRAQYNDPDVRTLIELKSQSEDKRGVWDTYLYPSLKRYGRVWDQLQVQGRRLVRVLPPKPGLSAKTQIVLPQSLVPMVLSQLHNVTTAAHLGVQKLQGKVRERFYWPGWFIEVKKWCQECAECGVHKEVGPTPRAPLVPSVTSRPYERIAVDILGPLPETRRENKYIMVVGDYFSK